MLFAIKNLRASRVNLIMNDFASGLPSPLAFIGFGEAIVRRLDLEPWCAKVLPILHRVNISQGRTKPEMENKSGTFTPIETMEDMTGTVEISLLLNLPKFESKAALLNIIPELRIAGGILQDNNYSIDTVPFDGSAFRGFRRGYAMIRPSLKSRCFVTTGEPSGLSEIASTLFPAERPQGYGWIVAAAVGYNLLENPENVPKRKRTRCQTVPHVFAEPVLGIAELMSVRNKFFSDLTSEGLSELLWAWSIRGNYVLGHPAYHPENTIS
jgi:CRISPR-associated protein (Cas_Csy2)